MIRASGSFWRAGSCKLVHKGFIYFSYVYYIRNLKKFRKEENDGSKTKIVGIQDKNWLLRLLC